MKTRWSETKPLQAAFALLFSLCAVSSLAQRQEEATRVLPSSQGSVIGHVEDGETRLPLRFAEIHLVPKRTEAASQGVKEQSERTNPPTPYLAKVLGHTDVDGNFRMDGVPTGDYLVGAIMPGYVIPGSLADANATNEQLKHLIASMPTVQVVAGRVASVPITLRRGAVIAGRVQFADGSPMLGATVEWEVVEKNLAVESVRLAEPSSFERILWEFEYYTTHPHSTVTDDHGRYYIFGLPPGNYIVSTILASQIGSAAQVIMSDGSSPEPARQPPIYPQLTSVYSRRVFRRSEAKTFAIHGTEQVMNADITVDLAGLHTVRGKLFAGGDRHVPSEAMLLLQEDGGKDVGKWSLVESDGSFQFDYLLSGSYTLVLMGARDELRQPNTQDLPQTLRRYKMARLAVVVGSHDLTLDPIMLTELKPGEQAE